MDDTNGPVFDHHDELFAQIGGAVGVQELKDFLEMTGNSVVSAGQADSWLPTTQLNYQNTGNNQRNLFCNNSMPNYDMACSSLSDVNSTAFIENFIKSLPNDTSEPINGLENFKRNPLGMLDKPASGETSSHIPGSLLNTMHRISTDNGTQEYLDALSKPDMLSHKPPLLNDLPAPLWNGVADPYNFHSSTLPSLLKPSMPNMVTNAFDRNGKCPPAYSNGIPDVTKPRTFTAADLLQQTNVPRSSQPLVNNSLQLTQPEPGLPIHANDLLTRELTHCVLGKGVSPSVSVESGIFTPTTGYDSTSPMSNSRTPLRSDDSISPLASCASPAASVRTPLRTDDCFSPGAGTRVRRTPLRTDETPSPRSVSRTPLRVEEAPSPSMKPLRSDDAPSPAMWPSMRTEDVSSPLVVRMPSSPAPSPRPIGRVSHRPDEAPSPRAISRTPLRSDDALSPRPVPRTPLRSDDALSPRPIPRTPLRSDDALSPRTGVSRTPIRGDDVPSPRAVSRTPVRIEEVHSPRTPNRTPLRTEEAPSPRAAGRTPPQAARTPLRVEDVTSPKAPPRTSTRTDEVGSSSLPNAEAPFSTQKKKETPTRPDVSPLPPRAPFSPDTVRRRESEIPAPPVEPGPSGLSVPPSKLKKRLKTESGNAPAAKKKYNKQVPIYQSSVSGEESGIKLKIKLAAIVPPKRRRRKPDEDHDSETPNVESKPGKRRKKTLSSPSEQSDWGSKMPPEILERIFKFVVDEEGSVPSLVRFSSVCQLWHSVAIMPELWQNVDLSSPCIKQKCKIDRYFRWLLENRLGAISDLNLNGWKFSNLPMVLSLIGAHCSEVESIGLSGWQGLHFEHLRSLLQDCPRLSRIDLSDVSPESKSTNSAVSPKSLTFLTETMGSRLTDLSLQRNTLSCLPQIISSLASNCPNLQVLDLSNIRRASHAEFALHVEELQMGCPLLRVLRIGNSGVTIASVPFDQQAASPGFVALEELSIAAHPGTESLRITSVMDDDCLERIVKTSNRLRLLDVRHCGRITESSLVRVPAWDIQHLYLSGCLITRQSSSGLELIAQKWRHSLVEIDLAWASVTEDVNAAVLALAEGGDESPLRVVNLCGSAVEPAPVQRLLMKCPQLESLNLQSCRGLPRGVKRLYERVQLPELLEMLQQSSENADD